MPRDSSSDSHDSHWMYNRNFVNARKFKRTPQTITPYEPHFLKQETPKRRESFMRQRVLSKTQESSVKLAKVCKTVNSSGSVSKSQNKSQCYKLPGIRS